MEDNLYFEVLQNCCTLLVKLYKILVNNGDHSVITKLVVLLLMTARGWLEPTTTATESCLKSSANITNSSCVAGGGSDNMLRFP